MSPALWVALMLGVVAVLYIAAAAAYAAGSRIGMAIAFGGYVVANIGLIIDVFWPFGFGN
jgi:hypothetical protein